MSDERFIVDTCGRCSDDRVFKNGEVVYNQRLGMAYSVDEIVEVLNQQGEFEDYFNDLVRHKIWYCQGMFKDTGDEKYKVEEECLRKLREEVHDSSKIFEYVAYLEEYHVRGIKNDKG